MEEDYIAEFVGGDLAGPEETVTTVALFAATVGLWWMIVAPLAALGQRTVRWLLCPERDFADWRDQQQSFEALIGFRGGTVSVRDTVPRDPAPAKRYSGAWVSPGFLELLRVDPIIGRA